MDSGVLNILKDMDDEKITPEEIVQGVKDGTLSYDQLLCMIENYGEQCHNEGSDAQFYGSQ